MREYELTVIYDLAVGEAGGPDASLQALTAHVETRGGRIARVDHWGRRRMAYPIGRAVDGDYIVSRIEIDPANVRALENALRIDERVYRHLVVRADELPPPPAPREPRRRPMAEEPVAPLEPPVPSDPEAQETAASAPEPAEADTMAAESPTTE